MRPALARLSGTAQLAVTPADNPWYASGAAGTITLTIDGKPAVIGHLGLFSEDIQKRYDLRQAAAGAEVDWDALLAAFQPVRRGSPLPKFPGVNRDLSVVVDEAARWGDIHAALTAANLAYLEKIDFVGTFRNKQIGAGKKSLTLSLAFRDPAATLRNEQVDDQVATAVSVLTQKFAATLRT